MYYSNYDGSVRVMYTKWKGEKREVFQSDHEIVPPISVYIKKLCEKKTSGVLESGAYT